MKKAALLGMGLFGAWAVVHYGYKALTGECPCTIRKNLQLKLALLLIKSLEAEGYLDLEEFSVGIPETVEGYHLYAE